MNPAALPVGSPARSGPLRWLGRWWPGVVLGGVFAFAAYVVFHKLVGYTFFGDDWEFLLHRRGNDLSTLLRPHGPHLSAVPILVYKVWLQIFGLTHFSAFAALIVAANLLCGGLLFVFARRRVGDVPALVCSSVLVLLGPAYEDLLWPFQIGFLGSIAAGIGMLLALDRDDRRGDFAAAALLFLALFSSSIGIAITVATAVRMLAGRDLRRALRVLALPVGLYGLWYLGYGVAQLNTAHIGPAVGYAAAMGEFGLSSLAGLGRGWGTVLGVGFVAAIIFRLCRGSVTPGLWASVALPITYFLITGVYRLGAAAPQASRYVYPSAVFLLILALEAARGLNVGRLGAVGLMAVGVLIVLSNLQPLQRGRTNIHADVSAYIGPELRALELARGVVDPGFKPDPVRSPDITAVSYFSAIDSFGSPADTLAHLRRRPEPAREMADITLLAALRAHVDPGVLPPAPGLRPRRPKAINGTVRGAGRCLQFVPTAPGASIAIILPTAGVAIAAAAGPPVRIRARRFADQYPVGRTASIRGNTTVIFKLARTSAPGAWHLRFDARRPLILCAIPRA